MTLFAEHYQQQVSPERIRIYEMALEGWSVAELDAACQRALATCRFFPTVADLRAAQRATAGGGDSEKLQAERAWDALMDHIRKWGAERTPLFCGRKENGEPIFERPEALEPEIDWAVRQCGGYSYVALAPAEKVHFIREDFLKHYLRHSETDGLKHIGGDEAKRLLGKVERRLLE